MRAISTNLTAALLAAALVGTAPAAAQAGGMGAGGYHGHPAGTHAMGYGGHAAHCKHARTGWRGHPMGHGMKGKRSLWRAVGMLQLSEEQRQEVTAAAADLRKRQLELHWKRREAAAQLPTLYAADQPDADAIGAVYGTIFDAKRERIQAEIEARNRVLGALTEEQRAQLHGMRHHPHHGYPRHGHHS